MDKKLKTPFIWALIGVIIGVLSSLSTIGNYFLYKTLEGKEYFGQFLSQFGANFDSLIIWSLISGIIGLVISVALIFYLVKITKKPAKNDYIVVTVLGALGGFIGMGFGGFLVLIGGIIGITRSK